MNTSKANRERQQTFRRALPKGSLFSLLLSICLLTAARAQIRVVTWHFDNARTGANTSEVILTPANVRATTFGKLFTQPVDGFVVGQPLYLPGVSVAGKGVHNVVYVATMNNSVYAFDADSGAIPVLWQTSLLASSPAGATPVPISVKGCAATVGWTQTGVISTPVIDPATNTMYLVAETYESSKVVHRLHALDVTSGQERTGSPVTMVGQVTYKNVTYHFVDMHQMNRPGLLLVNGHVYIAFGSAGCNGGDRGWVFSYDATTLQQDGVFDDELGGRFASFWQKGGGISADPNGNIYAETGEGSFAPGTQFPVSVVELSQGAGQLTAADWFTPYNWQYLDNHDLDLNTAVLILPPQAGPHPNEAIAVGKEGTIYVLDRSNMGHFCSTCTTANTQIVQELYKAVPSTGSAVYWNQTVFFTGGNKITAYKLNQGQLVVPTPTSKFVQGGGHPIITANGTSNGIIWNLSATGVLWAMDAQTLTVIYKSTQAANGRDIVPALAHFATPIIADGKLFVGTQTSLVVYGLLP